MKYVLFVDYRDSRQLLDEDCRSMINAYSVMKAQTISEAMIEADGKFNPDTMELVKIMEKDNGPRTFKAIMERDCNGWQKAEIEHFVSMHEIV